MTAVQLAPPVLCEDVPGRKQCVHGIWSSHMSTVLACSDCDVTGQVYAGEPHVCWSCGTDDGIKRRWNEDGSEVK